MLNSEIFNSVKFIIFNKVLNLQTQRNFFKVYFDGSPNYILVKEEDFISIMIKLAGLNYFYNIYKKDTSSYFFDITAKSLKQLKIKDLKKESVIEKRSITKDEYLTKERINNSRKANSLLNNGLADKFFDNTKFGF